MEQQHLSQRQQRQRHLGPGFGNRRAQRLDRSQHRLQTADLLDIALAADQQVHQAGRQGELLPQGQRQPADDRLRRLVDHVSAAVEYAQRGRPVVQGGLQEVGARRRRPEQEHPARIGQRQQPLLHGLRAAQQTGPRPRVRQSGSDDQLHRRAFADPAMRHGPQQRFPHPAETQGRQDLHQRYVQGADRVRLRDEQRLPAALYQETERLRPERIVRRQQHDAVLPFEHLAGRESGRGPRLPPEQLGGPSQSDFHTPSEVDQQLLRTHIGQLAQHDIPRRHRPQRLVEYAGSGQQLLFLSFGQRQRHSQRPAAHRHPDGQFPQGAGFVGQRG